MSSSSRPIVLASGSPRRFDLLSTLGLPFSVITSGVDETIDESLVLSEMVIQLAERKVAAVTAGLENGLVIGADTTVVIDGQVLNKPVDPADAVRMLRQLRGRVHAV